MNIFAQSFGLVGESDVISLSPDLKLAGALLIDSATGARHLVRRPARRVLSFLQFEILVSDWLTIATSNGLSTSEALHMLNFLDSIAGLQVKRTMVQEIRIFMGRCKLQLFGVKVARNAHRSSISFINISLATLRGSMPLVAAILGTSLLMYGINVSIVAYLKLQTMFIFTLISGTVVHELTHWFVIGCPRSSGAVVQRGLRIGIIHRSQPASRELLSAFAGPMAGLSWSLLIALILSIIFHNQLLANISDFTGLLHCLSWLPGYGDGKILWKFLKGHYAQA